MTPVRCLKQTLQLLATLWIVQSAAPAFAHHSQAAYDSSRVITFEGTVYRLDWKNPHIYLTVETTDENGKKRLQQIEGLAVTQANVDGFDRDALKPGTRVVVRANPNRGGAGKTVRGLDVTTPDGKVQPMYQRRAPEPKLVPADGLAGKWAPSLAETGKAFGAALAWKYRDRDSRHLVGACDVEPVPFVAMLDELRTIEVDNHTVVFHFDNSGDKADRVVHLDQSEHPAGVKPSLFGHSIGHWEGETLVVDTVDYAPHSSGLFSGYAAGPKKHTVERLTLTPDRLHLRWEVRVEDPDYLAEPASLSMVWDHRPDLKFTTVPCDPADSARYLKD